MEHHDSDEHVVNFMFSPQCGCACPVKGQVNKHNRFYLEYHDMKQTITVRCHNSECKKAIKRGRIVFCIQDNTIEAEDGVSLSAAPSLACMNVALSWSDKYCACNMERDYPIPEIRPEYTHKVNEPGVKRAIIAMKAQMGIGKTEKLIKQLRSMPASASALVVTHSRVFSNKMKTELDSLGFRCYMDGKPGVITDRRVVCCLDSIPRLKLPDPGGYNIIYQSRQ